MPLLLLMSKENSKLREELAQLDKTDSELISGISFQSMKAGLEKVFVDLINPKTEPEESDYTINLLQYLLEKRTLFSMGYTPENDEEIACAELVSRGLLQSYTNPEPLEKMFRQFWKPRGYRITSACCMFLNKLDQEASQ
jgi:seryl-tRNA synthetase